jgi:type I restriction enzyme, S subunit
MSDVVETRIGLLPRDWRVEPLSKTATKIQDGTHFSPKSEDGPCRYVTSKNIQFGHLSLSNCGWISQEEHDAIYARCDVKYGDVLLTKDGANTGNACLNDQQEPFSLLSSVAMLRTDGAANHAGFILQYLLSPLGQRRLKDLMSGNAITRLTLQKIKAFETPVPSATEQRRIAEILSTLDETIEQTEALIVKYQQIKAGLMRDLFTRGVTPDGKLRPTRAEAPQLYKESPFGWIPKEWEVKYLTELYGNPIRDFGSFSSTNLITFLESGVPFIKSEMIGVGKVMWDSVMFISEEVHGMLSKSHVQKGDILFSKIGSALGKAVIYDGSRGVCNSNAAIAKIDIDRRKATNFFVMYFLNHQTAQTQFKNMIVSLLPRINLGDINRLLVPVPLLAEQLVIEARLMAIDHALNSEEKLLDKQLLTKHGLMHDLLTGRVRVRTPAQ